MCVSNFNAPLHFCPLHLIFPDSAFFVVVVVAKFHPRYFFFDFF